MSVTEKQLQEVLTGFEFPGTPVLQGVYGNGHINHTYLLHVMEQNGNKKRMILQQMNRSVFKKPVEVMENIMGVTSHLRRKIVENGGDPERETLNVLLAKDGKPYYVDSCGEYWRIYHLSKGILLRAGGKRGRFLSKRSFFWKFPVSALGLSGGDAS